MALAIAILGFLAPAIPPLAKWLAGRASGYNAWKSEITYWVGRPRSIARQFVGRDAELRAVSNAFKRGDCVVLSGGPGTGKSQLAAELAHRAKRKGFWTAGGENPTLTLIALAHHLGIGQEGKNNDELLFQTRRRLQALPHNTPWVIDNLANLNQLNDLLSETNNVLLLVTTQDGRENVVPVDVEFQTVGVLDPEPAVRLLCRGGGHDPKQPIFLEIVEDVGRLPRAVEALAVQLDSPGESPERLLEELRAAPNPLELDRFQNQTDGLEIPRTESLFNALRGPVNALPEDVRQALAPLGYTADLPLPIPLAEALTGLSDGALISFFEECSSKSVLTADGDQIRLHSLTTAVIAATNPDGSLQAALQRAAERIGPIGETRNLVPVVEMGHYDDLLSWASPVLDQEDVVVLHFLNNLAIAYQSTGRYDEASRLHKDTLEVRQRVLGPEHPDILASRNNLANAYRSTGRYDEAARLHEENLEVQQRVLGPEHPDTLGSRNNLAAAYQSAGRYDQATRLYQANLEVMERVLGPEHPDTLGSRNNLAVAYANTGRDDEAARLHLDTLEVMERVLGPEHPDTLQSRNNLAEVYRAMGLDANALFEKD